MTSPCPKRGKPTRRPVRPPPNGGALTCPLRASGARESEARPARPRPHTALTRSCHTHTATCLCVQISERYGLVPDIDVVPAGVPGPGGHYVVQVLRDGEGLARRSGLLDRF